jgi:hypothetical protein
MPHPCAQSPPFPTMNATSICRRDLNAPMLTLNAMSIPNIACGTDTTSQMERKNRKRAFFWPRQSKISRGFLLRSLAANAPQLSQQRTILARESWCHEVIATIVDDTKGLSPKWSGKTRGVVFAGKLPRKLISKSRRIWIVSYRTEIFKYIAKVKEENSQGDHNLLNDFDTCCQTWCNIAFHIRVRQPGVEANSFEPHHLRYSRNCLVGFPDKIAGPDIQLVREGGNLI